VDAALTANGWVVVRGWEHEAVHDIANRVERVVMALASSPQA